MNDFTKEELIKLKDAMYGVTFEEAENKILRKKLVGMIDNYCEHNEPCVHKLHSSRVDIPLAKKVCFGQEWTYINTVCSIPKCHKCGMILKD